MKVKGQTNLQRIVEAANELFYHQGFNKTSFAEVAEASGIPKGNFYYYFKSKDELLEAVVQLRLDGIRHMLEQWQEALPDSKQRLKRFTQILLNEADDVLRYGCPMGSLTVELSKTQLAMHSKAREMFSVFVDWLVRQMQALGKGEQSRPLALHLLAMTQGIALISNTYDDKAFLQQEVARLNDWIDSL